MLTVADIDVWMKTLIKVPNSYDAIALNKLLIKSKFKDTEQKT